MSTIKKGDNVIILSGNDRGKKGSVIEILPKKGKIKVEGVGVIMKHSKPRAQGQKGGIIRKEAFIDISNVRLAVKPHKVSRAHGPKTENTP